MEGCTRLEYEMKLRKRNKEGTPQPEEGVVNKIECKDCKTVKWEKPHSTWKR